MKNQEKKEQWDQLLFLLSKDPEWSLDPETELYRQITTLGRELFKRENQPGGERIDEEKYITLKQHGYRMDQIAQVFHVSKNTLYLWRKEKGFINEQKQEAVNQ